MPVSQPTPDPTINPLIGRPDRLDPAVVADVLDRLRYRQQAMAPEIRPLFPEARLCGRAMPVLAVPSYSLPESDPDKLELEAVDHLKPGDVMVVSRIDGSFWGEPPRPRRATGAPAALWWTATRATRSRSSRWASRPSCAASTSPTLWVAWKWRRTCAGSAAACAFPRRPAAGRLRRYRRRSNQGGRGGNPPGEEKASGENLVRKHSRKECRSPRRSAALA